MSKRGTNRPRSRPSGAGRLSGKLIGVVAAAVVVVFGAAILFLVQQSTAQNSLSSIFTETAAKGPVDAKVVITEFSDYQ